MQINELPHKIIRYLQTLSHSEKIAAMRWLCGLLMLFLCLTLVFKGGAIFITAGVIMGIIGLAMISPKVGNIFSSKITSSCQRIKNSQKHPRYRKADKYIREGNCEKAEEELYWLVEQYPSDVQPHIKLVKIAIDLRKDQHVADMRLLHALRKYTSEEDQRRLKRAYNKLCSREIDFVPQPEQKEKPRLKTIKPYTTITRTNKRHNTNMHLA